VSRPFPGKDAGTPVDDVHDAYREIGAAVGGDGASAAVRRLSEQNRRTRAL